MPAKFYDLPTEQYAVCLVVEEGRTFGAKRARELFEQIDLTPQDFVGIETRALWAALSELTKRGHAPAESLLRAEVAKETSRDWKFFAEVLRTEQILNPATAKEIGIATRQFSLRRKAREMAQRIIVAAESGELLDHELVDMCQREAKALPSRHSFKALESLLDSAEGLIEQNHAGKRKPSVLTGIQELDEVTAGLPPTLCVVAAQPGVGKSAFWAAVVRNAARRGENSLTFSMEDLGEWLAFRYLSHEAIIPQFVLHYRKLQEQQFVDLGAADARIRQWPGKVLVDDRPLLRASEVLQAARCAFEEFNAAFVGVDNMTAMRFPRGQRMDLDMQDFLTEARALANEFQRPFVVLSHVRRREGLGLGDIPRLTDCSETSAFEKLSRMAIGLARAPESTMMRIGVLKNTNGKSGIELEVPMRMSSAMLETVQP